jgi:hypothetical protein
VLAFTVKKIGRPVTNVIAVFWLTALIVRMTKGDGQAIHRALLREEIGRIVADALTCGTTLNTSRHAASLFAAHPGAHWPVENIVDELVASAALAKVPVELPGVHCVLGSRIRRTAQLRALLRPCLSRLPKGTWHGCRRRQRHERGSDSLPPSFHYGRELVSFPARSS